MTACLHWATPPRDTTALRARGVECLQVKTMGPSKPNAEYGRTTHFYESRGFVGLEEVTGLCPRLPMLIVIKRI